MVRGAQAIARGGALWAAAVVLLALAPAASARTMLVQPDGKIVVAGGTPLGSGYLARLLPNGEPDPSFGVGGIAVDHGLQRIQAIALQPDGSIVELDRECCLARYTPDGQLDASFGNDGYVSLYVITDPTDLLVLPDGRVLVGGDQNHKLFSSEALLDLLSADGRTQEWVSSASFRTYMTGLVGSPDGSVLMLAGGQEELGRESLLTRFVPGSTPSYGDGYTTIEYPHPDPGYDKGFGGGAGIVKFGWPGGAPIFGGSTLGSGPDGIFVAAGLDSRLALARLDGNGLFDGSFGSGGFAVIGGGRETTGTASSVVVTPAGQVLLLGDFRRPRRGARCDSVCRTPLLADFNPDGRRDASFGRAGIARLPGLRAPAHGAEAGDLAVLGNGKILASARGSEGTGRVFLVRFGPDGSADAGFGSGGVLRFEPCPGSEAAQRRSGCLPSAEAALRVRRAAGGRTSLRLEVSPRGDWAEIDSLRVRLPSSLALRPDQVHRAVFSYLGFGQKRRRQPAEAHRGAIVFHRARGMDPGPIVLTVPPGVLRPVGPLPASLSFRVRVGFSPGYQASAGAQTLIVGEGAGQHG